MTLIPTSKIDANPSELNINDIPLFAQVQSESLKAITLDMVRYYSHGDILFRHGDSKKKLVILLEGQACVYRGDDVFIVCRSAPEVIGEQAFIDDTIRSATLKAQGIVKALVLPEATVQELMLDNAFVRNLLRLISCKLRQATDDRERHYRRENLLFSEFKAHLSEEVTDKLLATGTEYGRPRNIPDAIILFSDIRNFTARSAGMSAEEIAAQLGSYLSAIVDVIHQHGGLVDKFIGDAVMAVWGYTASDNKSVETFRCAEEMVGVAATMNFGGLPIRIGVGLNAGEVFSGNIGNEGKKQFTVLGTPVNLASRFESESKNLNAPIVLGQSVYKSLPVEIQERLTTHAAQPIKGYETQTLYTFDPLSADEKGQKQ